MVSLQDELKSNTATSEDWLEITKDMAISSFVEEDNFVTFPVNDQNDFTKADFESALRKVSRKVKK